MKNSLRLFHASFLLSSKLLEPSCSFLLICVVVVGHEASQLEIAHVHPSVRGCRCCFVGRCSLLLFRGSMLLLHTASSRQQKNVFQASLIQSCSTSDMPTVLFYSFFWEWNGWHSVFWRSRGLPILVHAITIDPCQKSFTIDVAQTKDQQQNKPMNAITQLWKRLLLLPEVLRKNV